MRNRPGQARGKRWGIRTLAFLALAAGCVIGSNLQGRYTLLTLLGLLVGMIGAGYCSVRGLMRS